MIPILNNIEIRIYAMINYLKYWSNLNNTSFLQEEYHFPIDYHSTYDKMLLSSTHILTNDRNHHFSHKRNKAHHMDHLHHPDVSPLLVFSIHFFLYIEQKIGNMGTDLKIQNFQICIRSRMRVYNVIDLFHFTFLFRCFQGICCTKYQNIICVRFCIYLILLQAFF